MSNFCSFLSYVPIQGIPAVMTLANPLLEAAG